MPAAVLYGVQSGIVRAVISSDDDDYDFSAHLPRLSDGSPDQRFALTILGDASPVSRAGMASAVTANAEAVVSASDAPAPDLIAQVIIDATGNVPEPARCVVIDDTTGDVVQVLMADPSLDRLDGCTLFQDENGSVGDVPDENGNFGPQPAEQ